MGSASAPLPARISAVTADVVDSGGLGREPWRSPLGSARRRRAAPTPPSTARCSHSSASTPPSRTSRRQRCEHAGRTPATIAKHLSAIRGAAAAAAVGADAHVRTVRSASVARGEPRALSHKEFTRLLKMPDRRTRQGKRDLALLHLLGSAGLRRSEAAALVLADVDERRGAADPRLRHAVKSSTSWWVTVRYAKRGRTRVVPLDDDALEAIIAWVKSRPPAATEPPLLSMPRAGAPGPLGARDIARIVGRHAAAADLPEDWRSPQVLRPRARRPRRHPQPRPSTPRSALRAWWTPSTSASDSAAALHEPLGSPAHAAPGKRRASRLRDQLPRSPAPDSGGFEPAAATGSSTGSPWLSDARVVRYAGSS
jgi:site-specific recombinase XerD